MSSGKPGVRQVVKAVLGAFIGVQSEQQRQQDFQSQSALPYIVTGVVLALSFVAILLLIVFLVLN
jgi:diacylglycerol kinase